MSFIRILLRCATALSGCGLVACSNTVNSPTLKECAPVSAQRGSELSDFCRGLVYALPKGQVQVIALRRVIQDKDVSDADGALQKATQAWAKAQAELVDLKKKVTPDPAKPLTELEKQAAQIAIDLKAAEVEMLRVSKDQSSIVYQSLKKSVGQWRESVSLVPQATIGDPDERFRFIANLSHDYTRDDQLTLNVLPNGLLTSTASIISEDKTPAVLADMIGTALALVTGMPGGGPGMTGRSLSAPPKIRQRAECRPERHVTTFDPTSAEEVSKLQGALKAKGFSFTIQTSVAGGAPSSVRSVAALVEPPATVGTQSGLFYRPQTVMDVELKISEDSASECEFQSKPEPQVVQVAVPDSRYVLSLPTLAGAFTKTQLGYEFKDGMPTKMSVQRPSELYAAWNIVPTAINRYAELLKLRIQLETSNAQLTQVQLAAQKAEIENLRSQIQMGSFRLQEQVAQQKAINELRTLAGVQ